jgi:hypothetical protein
MFTPLIIESRRHSFSNVRPRSAYYSTRVSLGQLLILYCGEIGSANLRWERERGPVGDHDSAPGEKGSPGLRWRSKTCWRGKVVENLAGGQGLVKTEQEIVWMLLLFFLGDGGF